MCYSQRYCYCFIENTLQARLSANGNNADFFNKDLLQEAQDSQEALQQQFSESGAELTTTKTGSIIFRLRFLCMNDLELFKQNLDSGLLAGQIKDILLTKKRYKVNQSRITFTIADPWEYEQCRRELTKDKDAVLPEELFQEAEQTVAKEEVSTKYLAFFLMSLFFFWFIHKQYLRF